MEEPEKGGGSQAAKFIIENVNSLSRLCHDYSIAPGNVEYSAGFKSALKLLMNQLDMKELSTVLLRFVGYIVDNVKGSDNEHTKKIAPRMEYLCSTCGLNHEARDFIRATLLYLLDQFEVSTDYLEYLLEEKYIDEGHHNEYYKIIQQKLGNRKSEGLKIETPITQSKTNEQEKEVYTTDYTQLTPDEESKPLKRSDKQVAAEVWFDGLKSP